MNFRRHRPRDSGARSHSSDWRYQPVEKGKDGRAPHSTVLRTAAASDEVKFYEKDPADWRVDLNDFSAMYWEWLDHEWEEWYNLTESQADSYMPV